MEMGELGAGGTDIDADADDDAVKDGSEGEDEETTFYDLPDVPIEGPGGAESRISGYAGDVARIALVDEFYEYTERTQGIRRPTDIDYDRFVVGSDGRTLELQVGVNKTVQITANVGTSKFLRLDAIARRIGRGGVRAVRDLLDLPGYRAKSKPPPAVVELERKADEAAKTNDDALDAAVDDVVGALEAATQTGDAADALEATTQTDAGLALRELQGLDHSLRKIRGEKAVQESKKVSLQQTLEGLRGELESPG